MRIIKLTLAIIAANVALIGYVYGYRLADFSEVPTSERPQGIYTQATLADIYKE